MDPVTIITLVTALATTTAKLLDKMPNYDEKVKIRFRELKRLFAIELAKPRKEWDSTALLNLRDEIILMNNQITRDAK